MKGGHAAVAWALLAAVALASSACRAAETPPADQADSPSTVGSSAADSSTAADSATADPASAPATAASTRLTPHGWGPLRIGMTRDEVVAALGEDANPGAVGGPDPAQCEEFRPTRAPEGMLVMIRNGRLTRISVSRGSAVTTDRGFGVGAQASRIEEAIGGDAVVTPHQYVSAPARYITVWAGDSTGPDARGVRYEINGEGRVSHIHGGGPSIRYVEGCV